MDIHIDEFNRDVAIALHKLYHNFPRPMALYIDEMDRIEEPDEFGVVSDRHQRCLGALLWLADEHIIRYADTIGLEGIDQAILTLTSFQALHSRYDNETSIIQALRLALKERSSEAVKRVIHQFLERLQQTR